MLICFSIILGNSKLLLLLHIATLQFCYEKGPEAENPGTGAVYTVVVFSWHFILIGRKEPHTPGERLNLGLWELGSSKDRGKVRVVVILG